MYNKNVSALEENARAIQYINEQSVKKNREKILKETAERDDFYNQMNKYRNHIELKQDKINAGLDEAFDGVFGFALKNILIESLGNLSEQGIDIACDYVDKYISEQGGAKAIINKHRGQTRFLDTVFNIVEETYNENFDAVLKEVNSEIEEEEKESSEEPKDNDESGEFKASENQDNFEPAAENENKENGTESAIVDAMKDLTAKIDEYIQTKKSDDNSDETKESSENNNIDFESAEDDEKSDEKPNSDTVLDDDVDTDDAKDLADDTSDESLADGDEATPESNTDKSVEDKSVEELDSEIPDEKDISTDKDDLFTKMEKEDSISAAVDLLSKRIKDAEEDFIKKNALDKKKIENIVSNLNDRINGATGEEISNEDKEEAQNEVARLITEVRENRFHSIFEEMVKSVAEEVLADSTITESYRNENGKLDMGSIVETAKVMYGFLEFVNTIQLEKVDEKFIKNILDNK